MNNKGISLAEIMLTVMILGVGISATFTLLAASMASSQLSWDTTVATTHAEHILEEMEGRKSLAGITSENWQKWFNAQGIPVLPGEEIEVTYKDPKADPLQIDVKVGWQRKSREGGVSLVTRLTK